MSSSNYLQLFHYPKSTLFWYDDFLGTALDTKWNLTVVGTGAGAVIDQQTGGVYRLSAATNATADEATLGWNNIRSLLVSKLVSMEARCLLSSAANVLAAISLFNAATDLIRFILNRTVSANWYINTIAGGASTSLDSGVAADTNYHFFQIQTRVNSARFFIDGVETANSPIVTNVTALYLQAYFDLLTQAAAVKQLDIDYVACTQNI